MGEPECQAGAVRLELCLSWQGWPLSQGQRSFQERRRGGFAVAKANLDFHFILYALALVWGGEFVCSADAFPTPLKDGCVQGALFRGQQLILIHVVFLAQPER